MGLIRKDRSDSVEAISDTDTKKKNTHIFEKSIASYHFAQNTNEKEKGREKSVLWFII